MEVLITGSSSGMGLAAAKKFIEMGHEVYGLDLWPTRDSVSNSSHYHQYIVDVREFDALPNIEDVQIVINNAGLIESGQDIEVNLIGTMNVTEKYVLGNSSIRSVLNQSDACAKRGIGPAYYVASKGGVVAYTKWTAREIAWCGATCNCLSFGGVLTRSNDMIVDCEDSWNAVMESTPLKKWTDLNEVAEWIYFMTVVNKSCSGQDIVIDNLESLNGEYI